MALLFVGGVAYFILSSGSEAGSSDKVADSSAVKAGEKTAAGEGEKEQKPALETTKVPASASPFMQLSDAGSTANSSDAAAAQVNANEPGSDALLRANGEVDRPAGLVTLTLESEPTGATVVRKRDRIRLGVTPYTYEAEDEFGTIVFVLEMEGYRSTSVSMPANRDGIRQVNLLPGKSSSIATGAAAPPVESKPVPKARKLPAEDKPAKREPKKTSPPRSDKPRKKVAPKAPKRRADPPAPPKKKSGKVDYNADPIPFD